MSQMELMTLMDKIPAENWLVELETKEHPQEEEAAQRCDDFYDYLSSFVH